MSVTARMAKKCVIRARDVPIAPSMSTGSWNPTPKSRPPFVVNRIVSRPGVLFDRKAASASVPGPEVALEVTVKVAGDAADAMIPKNSV